MGLIITSENDIKGQRHGREEGEEREEEEEGEEGGGGRLRVGTTVVLGKKES